jgi:TonB-dependent starch-binding outer membrane protein SusC
MKKLVVSHVNIKLSYQFLRKMKLTILFLLTSVLSCISAETYSQITKLNVVENNSTLLNVLQTIENQSEFNFFYNEKVDIDKTVSVDMTDKTVYEILDKVLANSSVKYKVMGRQIALYDKNEMEPFLPEVDQNSNISGKVIDKSGAPLPGVSIFVKGTTTGTTTDINGNFFLALPSDAKILTFSFIGMESQEINIGTSAKINVTMVESAIGLEEVVVVGYGSQKKRDVIGSISTIKSAVLETAVGSTNFNSLLQGQAAGVSVQSSSGRLGALVDITVRGLSSISAGTDPLWIIDGVPIMTSIYAENNGSAAQSPMALINQSDIESIQVLKDAAATSIYGSRGSNGVIMVTTKSGVYGKTSLNLDFSTGISELPFHKVKFANTTQWFQIMDEAKQDYGLGAYNMSDFYSLKPYSTEFLTRAQAEAINTDWLKETMRSGSFQNINISTSGGDKEVRYFLSANYRKDNSVMTNEDLERYGLRANIDLKPIRSLDIGTKINLSSSKGNRGKNERMGGDDGNKSGISGGFGFVNNTTVPFEPVYSLVNPLLYYNPYGGNPVATSDRANLVEELDIYRVLASLYGEYALPFIKGLSARTELSVDYVQANRNFWVSDIIRFDGSLAQDNASTSQNVNYNLFLKYNKVFGDHSFNLTAGTESERSKAWWRKMEGLNMIGAYPQLGTPSLLISMYSGLNGEGYLKSYFGRANYKFKDKYLIGISIRRDGSSVFTPDFRWGNFIALSAGWILSDESFMREFGITNSLKIRGSYGQTGNANIPGNLDVSNYNGDNIQYAYGSADIMGTNGTILTSIGVSNLQWEKTNNLDLGLDFSFFNHRIDGSVAYYNKYVKDLLLAISLPPSSGIGSIWGNIGDLVNSGIEFSVTSSNLESGRLKWLTTLNIAFNHNEVKRLTPEVDKAGTGMVSPPYITKVGYGIRDYYLADFAGIDPQTGLSQIYALDQDYYTETGETRRLKDSEGKDVLLLNNNPNANTNLFHMKGKNEIPKYYGGFTNKFTYKAFDLSVLVTFSGGNYILDYQKLLLSTTDYYGEILEDYAQNYWKKPGDIAKYQRLDWNGNIKMEDGTIIGMGNPRTWNDQFLYKGDFVKLKSISFGYTLPISFNNKNIFQALRLYANVENLYTLTKYPGWDPEGQGLVGQYDLPQLFSASVGVSIKF